MNPRLALAVLLCGPFFVRAADICYTQVDAVYSTGKECVLTDYRPNPKTWMKAKLKFAESFQRDPGEGKTRDFFGVREAGSAYAMSTCSENITNKDKLLFPCLEDPTEALPMVSNKNVMVCAKLTVANDHVVFTITDGNAITNAPARTSTSTLPLALLGSNTADGPVPFYGYKNCYIYSWQIFENDDGTVEGANNVLVRDYVPATNAVGTAGLLDRVTGAFLTSATDYALSCTGPDITTYLVSEGTVREVGAAVIGGLYLDSRRVASSPYATGGDLVLKDGDDYIHVFLDTSRVHTFTPAQAMMARVLAVGGGGAGGTPGGGGGAGGMLDRPSVAFAAGSYSVTVGAGGAWPASVRCEYSIDRMVREWKDYDGVSYKDNTAWTANLKSRFAGHDSFISNADENDVIRVLGGGGGGSASATAGMDGGSGGGAYQTGAAGLGVEGQGHNGARNAGETVSAGGGGAGGAAEDINRATPGGDGGIGRNSDILGFDQLFAGGGGGGTQPSKKGGLGGAGGGGDGATGYNVDNARHGQNGLGGGGGGAGGQTGNAWTFPGANGGSGIVVIRYTDPTKASSVPVIALEGVTTNADATATLAWTVMGTGNLDVIAVWGDAADHLCYTTTVATVTAGSNSAKLQGLLPGRTYHVALKAANASGETSDLTGVASFTMPNDGAMPETLPSQPPIIGEVVIKDGTGGDYVFLELQLSQAGEGLTYGGCTATVRWSTQNSYAQMTEATTLAVDSEGRVTLRPTGLSTAHYYACIEVVNASGFVDRIYVEFCSSDDSVYCWNPEVTEGAWKDPANWTSETAKSWGLGYPLNEATADFTSTQCATVHVAGVVKVMAYGKEVAGGEYVFVGDTEDAEIHASRQFNGKRSLLGDQRLVFDHVKANLIGGFTEPYVAGASDTLILTNGAFVSCCRNGAPGTIIGFEKSGTGGLVEITTDSTLHTYSYGCTLKGAGQVVVTSGGRIQNTSMTMAIGGGQVVVLDDAGALANNYIDFAAVSSEESTQITVRGARPSIQSLRASVFARYADAVFTLMIPSDGWTEKAVFTTTVNSTRLFAYNYETPADNGNLVFSVPKTAPIKASASKSSAESKIVDWPQGIDVAHVRFGSTAQSSDYFYYTDAEGAAYVYAANGTDLVSLENPSTALAQQPTVTGLWYHHASHPGLTLIIR